MRGLRLVVWDATDLPPGGSRLAPRIPRVERGPDGTAHGTGGLSPWWRIGASLHRLVGYADASLGAASWAEALGFVVEQARATGRPVAELQAWGHGGWGYMGMGREHLDGRALLPGSALANALDEVRDALTPDALVWLRCCSAFGAAQGRAFAERLADRMRVRVAGHTYVIGALQSGTRSLSPGQRASWPNDEGLELRGGEPSCAKLSGVLEPRTISCVRLGLPSGW